VTDQIDIPGERSHLEIGGSLSTEVALRLLDELEAARAEIARLTAAAAANDPGFDSRADAVESVETMGRNFANLCIEVGELRSGLRDACDELESLVDEYEFVAEEEAREQIARLRALAGPRGEEKPHG
jgi:arginyl-tRNA synthetase